MQTIKRKLVLSVSDLTGFLVCEHLTQLERAATEARTARPTRDDPDLDILLRRGEEHEQHYLSHLRAEGLTIVEFPDSISSISDLFKIQEATLEAMRMGMDVIYQSTLFDGRWLGRPDIMRREQIRKLRFSGIRVVADLAVAPPGLSVRGIGQSTLDRLPHQARLQVQQREDRHLT